MILPLSELKRNGWDAAWREGVPPQEADRYPVIVAQRLDKPEALPIWRRSRLSHRLVYETDDDWFSVPPERFSSFSNGRGVFLDSVIHAAQVADIVTVSTPPLAEVMARETGHRDVRVLENCIPAALLGLERNRNRRKVIAGWQGGASHEKDVAMIAPALRHFTDRHKRAELHFMGCDFSGLTGRRARVTGWVPVNAGLDYYRGIDFDIGLAPLTGTIFDQSKSSIKALEYMALGIPVLASDCEPYRGVVIDGVNGYLIRRQADWGRRLHELACDEAARAEMGAKARETARAHTIESRWHEWADVYKELQ